VVRAGARLRLIVAPGGPDAEAVAEFLRARGLQVTLAEAVEPSVVFTLAVLRFRKQLD
jgi:hypothetical protein